MVQFFSLTQPSSGPGHASKTGTSLFASAVGKVYMLESAEPEDRAVESIFVAAPSGPAVCEPPHDPQNAVLLSSRARGSEPPAIDSGPEPSESDLMPSCRIILSLLALHGSCGDGVPSSAPTTMGSSNSTEGASTPNPKTAPQPTAKKGSGYKTQPWIGVGRWRPM